LRSFQPPARWEDDGGALVSAASGANTAVARTSIGIAAEPVGRARFERVLQRLTSGRLTAGDLIAGVLRRTTRQGARHCDAERRQDERFHALLLVFLLPARLCGRIADTAILGPRVAPELVSAVARRIRALGPHGGSSAVHQAGRTSGRFLGKPAMTERSRLSVSAISSLMRADHSLTRRKAMSSLDVAR
jgi:hypothetical protein